MDTTRLSSRVDETTARLNSPIIGLTRIAVGVLWLANLEWKRPPDFGKNQMNGLYKYVDSAVRLPVFAPYSWFVEHVVVKQYTLFGWVTLLVESALAACLILGLYTRAAAAVGAVMSVNILLSVLHYDKSYEWPWSYYLMFAIHLLLIAAMAGRHWGLDGVLRAGAAKRRRAIQILGSVAVVIGVVGLVASRSGSFAAEQGSLVGWSFLELKVLWFNPLSAILTAILGCVALAGAMMNKRILTVVSGAVFAFMALQVIIQWRYNDGAWTGGVLGGTGGNLAFWALLAAGLLKCTTSNA